MRTHRVWSRALEVAGGVAMAVGTVDPLEGAVLILPGSGLVALGVYLDGKERGTVWYWASVFILIALGVAAMMGLGSLGGIGGRSGLSMWWGVLMLPYPIGWLMALVGGVVGLIRYVKGRGRKSS